MTRFTPRGGKIDGGGSSGKRSPGISGSSGRIVCVVAKRGRAGNVALAPGAATIWLGASAHGRFGRVRRGHVGGAAPRRDPLSRRSATLADDLGGRRADRSRPREGR